MRIVFRHAAGESEVEVVVRDADAVVSHLAAALAAFGGAPVGRLWVDGKLVPPSRRLDRAGVRDGSTVSTTSAPSSGGPEPPGATDGQLRLAVIGGLDAGAVHLLPAGPSTVGRDDGRIRLHSPTVSATHATVTVGSDQQVSVADRGSLNGTWVDGRAAVDVSAIGPTSVVRLGAVQVGLAPPVADDEVVARTGRASRSTIPHNRPPRSLVPDDVAPIDRPRPPAPARGGLPVGIVAVVAPLVMGLVMIKVFGSLVFGLFALLSPIILVGGAVESRRRAKRGRRRARVRFDHELVRLAELVRNEAERERNRLGRLAPDPAEVLRRAIRPSTRLWERRPGHADFLCLRIGIASVRWEPPVAATDDRPSAEVEAVLEPLRNIADAPLVLDLARDPIVGLVGDRRAALAVARWLVVQAATHQGPADLCLAVAAAPAHAPDWDWAKWLPHVVDPADPDQRRLAAEPLHADRLLRALVATHADDRSRPERPSPTTPTLLVVLDDESLTEGRRSPARSVLRGHAGTVAGIVLASSEDRLPATCTTVIELLDRHGTARSHRLDTGERLDDVLASGISEPTARSAARALARFEDPEAAVPGGSLPSQVGLLPLLDLNRGAGSSDLADAIEARWAAAGPDPALVTPIGVGEDGPLAIDLVADGPHALIAGTTGAGKSELLRTLVAGLATSCSPDHITFVLIDFKGGSAFDQCARLPHTVGMVTDLDPYLAQRALRCLEAELRHRERRLRSVGAADLAAYRTRPGSEPLPRLVVVIDEFAALKADLGGFVDSLVGIAQRGRSLGVHLVLATQRPSGAVSDSIRANMNLRIALRVQDEADSGDVIDRPDAAHIGRSQPGRALARLGPGEVIAVQTALATGVRSVAGPAAVDVRAFTFDRTITTSPRPPDGASVDDLGLLADGANRAWHRIGHEPPRRPWPDPLPPEVHLEDLARCAPGPALPFGTSGTTVAFALADDPDHQAQHATGWDPSLGNLLLIGLPGSGTTTACASLALAISTQAGPDDVHLYMLDFGAGGLAPLALLPHVGSVVSADDRERQARMVRWLRRQLERRRSLADPLSTEPRIVLILDGIAGFRAEWDDPRHDVGDGLQRVFAEGPGLGLHTVVTADRVSAVPSAMYSLARQRWLFHLADRHDYGAAGLRPDDVPVLTPGGAMMAEARLEVRVATPRHGLAEALRPGSVGTPCRRPPPPVGALPTVVAAASIAASARLHHEPRFLPLGVGDAALEPVGVEFGPAQHLLIAGPARSGRTTALLASARILHASGGQVVVAIADSGSPLRTSADIDHGLDPGQPWPSLDGIDDRHPVWVLIDDAERLDDADGMLAGLLARRLPHLHVITAGRNEALRSAYGHWTGTVRTSRSALLLDPDLDLDGDLAAVTLPRRSVARLGPGRGYLVADGGVELAQVARP